MQSDRINTPKCLSFSYKMISCPLHRCLLFLEMPLLLFVCGCACSDNSVKTELRGFMSRTISFPDTLLVFDEGKMSLGFIPCEREQTLVYFMGYKDCFDCEISHLHNLVPIFQKAEFDARFHSVVIIVPENGNLEHILHAVRHAVFPYPIYISMDSEWARTSGIPEDSRFHAFLLDKNNHPKLVGNPLSSEKMMSLFEKALVNEK